MSQWAAILVAAGTSTRFGDQTPKQYQPLAGKPLLEYSLNCLKSIDKIAIVVHPDHVNHYTQIITKHPNVQVVHGGKTRQESVYLGLQALKNNPPKHVLIHDAARPFLSDETLSRMTAQENQSATLAVPIIDTLMQANGQTVDRENLLAIQTPQAFDFDLVLDAHAKAAQNDNNYTDDAGLVAGETNIRPVMIPGDPNNFKVTTQDDFIRAEQIMTHNYQTRTGIGYDVHRFGDTATTTRLFGCDIPCTHALLGHSDADAGLHAIADSILGTIGAGDIGILFPPSDPSLKDMDSAIIVEKAMELLHTAGGTLTHIDIMLMAEMPKIGPHREMILERLSTLLNLPSSSIGLKATTMECMGAIGNKEGLAVQTIATVKTPS